MTAPVRDTEWMDDAACKGADVNAFFPHQLSQTDARTALAICAECLVRQQCLTYSLRNGIGYGIWGGHGQEQRRRMPGFRPRSSNEKEEWQVSHGTLAGAQWHRRHASPLCPSCAQAERERASRVWAKYREKERDGAR